MKAHIGDFVEPLPHLAVEVRQIGERAQGPEIGTKIGDAPFFNFSFFPPGSGITSPGVKAVLAGEGEEARVEAHQAPIVLGHGG